MYEEKKKGRGLEGLFELARGEKIKKKTGIHMFYV